MKLDHLKVSPSSCEASPRAVVKSQPSNFAEPSQRSGPTSDFGLRTSVFVRIMYQSYDQHLTRILVSPSHLLRGPNSGWLALRAPSTETALEAEDVLLFLSPSSSSARLNYSDEVLRLTCAPRARALGLGAVFYLSHPRHRLGLAAGENNQ